jgi:alkylation response protein AidB-like acyl-CoA dehydrogenase
MALRELRGRALAKFPLAGRMWFTRDGLEQASSAPLARHRAARYAGFRRVADLCTGIGGDLCALAPGRAAVAVDLDPVHLRMARENARVYGAGEVAAARAAADAAAADPAGWKVAAAKIRTGEAAGRGAEIAHQVLGAIGFTDEHPLHLFTRLLWRWRDEFGTETEWAEVLGRDVAGTDPWPLVTETADG